MNIPFDSFQAADVRKTVRLRNINFNGFNTGIIGVRITGGTTIAAGVVIVDDCLIDGNFGGSARGISDERTAGGGLFVSNTTVRNVGQFGITANPGNGAVAGQRIDVVLDNVRVQNAFRGATFGANVRVMINRSVFSGNSSLGIGVGVQTVEANISNSVISNNATGILNAGGTTTIRLGNNDIAFNTTALSGATFSFGNNRIQGNGSLGTAPTAINQQ